MKEVGNWLEWVALFCGGYLVLSVAASLLLARRLKSISRNYPPVIK